MVNALINDKFMIIILSRPWTFL